MAPAREREAFSVFTQPGPEAANGSSQAEVRFRYGATDTNEPLGKAVRFRAACVYHWVPWGSRITPSPPRLMPTRQQKARRTRGIYLPLKGEPEAETWRAIEECALVVGNLWNFGIQSGSRGNVVSDNSSLALNKLLGGGYWQEAEGLARQFELEV